mgnify:CR=1 FL=1
MNPNDPGSPQGGTPPAQSPTEAPTVPDSSSSSDAPAADIGAPAEQTQEPAPAESTPQTSANCHCGKPSAGGNCTGCNQPEATCSCTPAV